MRQYLNLASQRVVTIPELAKHFRLSPATAWRLILTGKIPSVKIGKSRRTTLEAASAALTALQPAISDIDADCRAEGL